MIKSAHLINYRSYVDRKFIFEAGLIVIRGVSEAGKSTIVEAIAYAEFGSKMLRDGVADAVNWDAKKMTAMKVIVEHEVHGVLYTISRGKSGAEITYTTDKKHSVTGQKECTEFMEKLLQIPKGKVNELILAGQNDVQGILKQGSTALAVTIERLAGFEQVDALIESVKDKYPSGAAAQLEEQLKTLRDRLKAIDMEDVVDFQEEIKELLLQKTDLNTENDDIDTALGKIAERVVELKASIEKLEGAKEKADTLKESHNKAAGYTEDIVLLKNQLTDLEEQMKQAKYKDLPGPIEVTAIEDQITDSNLILLEMDAFETFHNLPKVGTYWEEGKQDFADNLAELLLDIKETEDIVRGYQGEIDLAKSKLNYDENCVTCHQSIKDLPEIVKLNQAQESIISDRATDITEQQDLLEDAAGGLKNMLALQELDREVQSVLVHLDGSDFVSIDKSTYPVKVTWLGGEVPTGQAFIECRDETQLIVEKLNKKLELASQHAGQLKELEVEQDRKTTSLESLRVSLKTVKASLEGVEAEDLEDIVSKLIELKATQVSYDGKAIIEREANASIDYKLQVISDRLVEIDKEKNSGKIRKEELNKQITTIEVQYKEVAFGSALIKTVRDARVKIANKLWSVVLTTVSSYFTTMRGIPTTITKSAKGFKVNDKALESLSGSTLDVCGVALRLAVIQMFLPATDFAIFDEVSGGCDDERTSAVTGFLLGSGFSQTFLLTHKAVDEGAASQLIVV